MKATTKLNRSFMSITNKKGKKTKRVIKITDVEILDKAEIIAKEAGIGTKSTPKRKDLQIAQIMGDYERVSKRKVLRDAGYSKQIQDHPRKYFETQKYKNAEKTIQAVAKDMGITQDFILAVVTQDIVDKGVLDAKDRNRMREVEVLAKLVGAGTYGDKEDNKTGALTLIEVNIDNITAKEAKSLLEGSL